MAPGLTSDIPIHSNPSDETKSHPQPLKLSGALNHFSYEDTTPVIGREFHNVNIVDDLLNASNADELLRDLAINSTIPTNDPIPDSLESLLTRYTMQSLSVALSSSGLKTILRMICRNSSFRSWARRPESLPRQRCTSTLC